MFSMRVRGKTMAIMLIMILVIGVLPVPTAWAQTPTLNIIGPLDGTISYTGTITVTGKVGNTASSGLRVQGQPVYFDANGNFSTQVTLEVGDNILTVTATSSTGHTTTKTVSVHYIAAAPKMEITSPANNATVSSANVNIVGKITNITADTVLKINGDTVGSVNPVTGAFSHPITLNQGSNSFYLRVTAGGVTTSEAYLYLTYRQTALLDNLRVNSIPATDFMFLSTSNIVLTGSIPTGAGVTINGSSPNTVINGNFTANRTIGLGENAFTLEVTAANGEKLVRTFRVLYDNGQPIVYNLNPAHDSTVYSSSVTVTGSVYRASGLTVGGNAVSISSNNTFSRTLSLTPGSNTITIIPRDGIVSNVFEYTLNYEAGPVVTIKSPADGYETGENQITVEGEVNQNTTSLKVKNETGLNPVEETINIKSDRSFSHVVKLKPGQNNLVFTAAKSGSPSDVKTIRVTYNGAPVLNISAPINNSTVYADSVIVGGTVVNVIAGGLKINGSVVNFDSGGGFSRTVKLEPGTNVIELTATDGNTTVTKKLTILCDIKPVINVAAPVQGLSTPARTVTVTGKALNTDKWGFSINGEVVPLKADGSFTADVNLTKVNNSIELKATKDNMTTVRTVNVTYTGGPVINVKAPVDGSTVFTNTVTISGTVFPLDGLSGFTIGADTTYNVVHNTTNGTFEQVVSLKEGDNKIKITVSMGTKTSDEEVTVKYDNSPGLTVNSLFDGMTIFSNKVTINGYVERTAANGLKINNSVVEFNGTTGRFSERVTLVPGSNTITVLAAKGSKTKTLQYTVYYNDIARHGAVAEYTAKRGEETKAFQEYINLKMAANDYVENVVTMKIIDPEYLEEIPVSSAFVGPVMDVQFDKDPLQPFTLSLKYDSVIKDAQTAKLSIFYFDEDKDEWVVLGGRLDKEKGTVTVETSKPGKYAVMVYYKTFDDVMYHWGRKDIEYLMAQGVATGVAENRFNPDGIITRAEFATFLVKACGLAPYEPERRSFSDVSSNHWAYPYVEAAVRAGIVSGVTANSFAPSRSITREQAAIMLARAANVGLLDEEKVKEVLEGFMDGNKVSWYSKNEVAAVVDAGLMRGMGGYKFNPQGTATRAQAAAMIVRLMERIRDAEG